MADKDWTDELKQEVVDAYLKADPTPETTMDIVKNIAEEFEKTPNGVRMVLTRAGAYVKKEQAKTSSSTSEGTKTKRVDKAAAIDALKKVIEDGGKAVDDDICDRLTGKAAVYFTEILG